MSTFTAHTVDVFDTSSAISLLLSVIGARTVRRIVILSACYGAVGLGDTSVIAPAVRPTPGDTANRRVDGAPPSNKSDTPPPNVVETKETGVVCIMICG